MAFSVLSLIATPTSPRSTVAAKTPGDYPSQGMLVYEFDLWQEGYAGAIVNILRAGTTDIIPVYRDINLTIPADNPHTLLSREDDTGATYGKFRYSLYSPYSYELDIQNVQQSGIQLVPITTLDGEDASLAEVTIPNSTLNRSLEDRFADVIRLVDYGEVVDNTDTNTTNLNSAISAASAQGGGVVYLPAGTIAINSINLPAKVILKGEGKSVTVIESIVGDEVITLTGDACGLMDLTIDGVDLVTGSVGIYSKAKDDVIIERVKVKRLDTGLLWLGGIDPVWRDFDIDNCVDAVRLLGDQNVNNGNDGDEISGGLWDGGVISNTTGVGLELSVRDKPVSYFTIRKVDFIDNVGADGAVLIYGASFNVLDEVYFDGNTINLTVADNPDDTISDIHEVVGLRISGKFNGGTLSFDGVCQDVYLDMCQLVGVTIEANVPDNPIILRDCTETDVSITGDATKVNRFRTNLEGAVTGSTTNGTAVVAWKTRLEPHEIIQLEVRATAEQINGDGYAEFFEILTFRQAGATLLYDAQTANFTVGSEITGATSGATAIIAADSDSGTTGTLTLASVIGEFVDNEIITDTGGGSARSNGVLVYGAVTTNKDELHVWGSNAGAAPAGWAITAVASGREGQVHITGAAATTIDWNLKISTVRL